MVENIKFPKLPPVTDKMLGKKRKRTLGLSGCRSINNFAYVGKIAEGAFGIVYKAKDKQTNEFVAIKRIKMDIEKDGFPITSIREVNILLYLRHKNIVRVKEVVFGQKYDEVYMVMEYVNFDLKTLLVKNQINLKIPQIKCLLYQILEGVDYMHSKWMFHRDLKTSNLLLNSEGEIKLADFGLARRFGKPVRQYTRLVVTLWYRAPELLLDLDNYSWPVDIWSVGCIMGELVLKEAVFTGKDEIDQLNKIFKILGTPTKENWKKFGEFKKIIFKQYEGYDLKNHFINKNDPDLRLDATGLDLMTKLLTFDPEKRITASAALEHEWFIGKCAKQQIKINDN